MTTKKNFLIQNFKARYTNKSSKWFVADVKDFTSNLDKVSESRLDEMYHNATAFDSSEFEAKVAKEEKKMAKAGLYEMGNMKPVNALD